MLQHHLQDTYQYLFDQAHAILAKGESFRPFGAAIRKTGEQIETIADMPAGHDGAQDHVRGLILGFQQDDRDNGLMAAGLVFDGQMTDGFNEHSRALVFHLEAANGRAVEVVVAYEMRIGNVVDFFEPEISEVTPEIFLSASL